MPEIIVGTGATHSVGSDSYPLYVTEVKQKGRLLGLCSAESHFDDQHPWQAGDMVVEPFDPKLKTEFWLKKYGKKWYHASPDGTRHPGSVYRISFGGAYSYRDPSF